jgi:hypothetical protein
LNIILERIVFILKQPWCFQQVDLWWGLVVKGLSKKYAAPKITARFNPSAERSMLYTLKQTFCLLLRDVISHAFHILIT